MGVWIESDVDLADHPKTLRLAAKLGVDIPQAVGLMTLLWHFTMKYAWRNGDLEKWGDEAVAKGARWSGDAATLIEAFRYAELLDGWIVHDWLDRAGRIVNDRIYNERRKKKEGRRKADSLRRITPRVAVNRRDSSLPNPTQPNPTQPDKTEPKDIAASPPKSLPPHTQFVQGFEKTYEAMTGQKFKAGAKEYTLAASLLKQFGMAECVSKVQTLGELCRYRSAWFTKDGWAAFTIPKLSEKWNEILPRKSEPTKEQAELAEMEKWRRT